MLNWSSLTKNDGLKSADSGFVIVAPKQQLNTHLFLFYNLSPLVAVSSPRHFAWLPAENCCPNLNGPLITKFSCLAFEVTSFGKWWKLTADCSTGKNHSYDYPASGVLLTHGYPSSENITNNKILKVVAKLLLLNC